MKWFDNMRISSKLLCSFILVALIGGVTGWLGYSKLHNIDQSYSRLIDEDCRPLAHIGKASEYYQRQRVNLRDIMMDKTQEDMEKHVSRVRELDKLMLDEIGKFEKSIRREEVRREIESLKASWVKYEPVRDKIVKLAMEGKNEEALALTRGEGIIVATSFQNSVIKLVDMSIANIDKESDINTTEAGAAEKFVLVLAVAGLIISVVLGLLISMAISKPLNLLVGVAERLAVGDTDIEIETGRKDEIGRLMLAMKTMIESISALIGDTGTLVDAAVEGKLATRADAAKHKGDYRKIIEGINQTIDAIVGPLNMAANYVERIGEGSIPSKITEAYKGDFNTIKNSLNACIDNINALVVDTDGLVKAALDGKLSARADASRHNGDFKKIIEGINHTLDAIVEPVSESTRCLKSMASGNMDVSVNGQYKGDHAIIKDALNATVDSINSILSQVRNAAVQVGAGSSQVSDSSQSLSQGATEQAASLEEITSSITELASQTKANAENATQANLLAVGARESAEKGTTQMNEMLGAMKEINDASQNIAKIIKVIDDIAFQTNLLALNAAVEAARAGRHGKGFAVVAEEVRNLAGRSAKAARETTDLIESSVKKVGNGSQIANKSAEALKEIVISATRVADLLGEIAAASNEQAQGIFQVNQGLGQIDSVTQQNTANAEQTASASEELSAQAAQLNQTLSRFKLRGQAQGMMAAQRGYGQQPPRIDRQKVPAAARAVVSATTGWGGITPVTSRSEDQVVRPEDVISLDDQEFGKY